MLAVLRTKTYKRPARPFSKEVQMRTALLAEFVPYLLVIHLTIFWCLETCTCNINSATHCVKNKVSTELGTRHQYLSDLLETCWKSVLILLLSELHVFFQHGYFVFIFTRPQGNISCAPDLVAAEYPAAANGLKTQYGGCII